MYLLIPVSCTTSVSFLLIRVNLFFFRYCFPFFYTLNLKQTTGNRLISVSIRSMSHEKKRVLVSLLPRNRSHLPSPTAPPSRPGPFFVGRLVVLSLARTPSNSTVSTRTACGEVAVDKCDLDFLGWVLPHPCDAHIRWVSTAAAGDGSPKRVPPISSYSRERACLNISRSLLLGPPLTNHRRRLSTCLHITFKVFRIACG